MILLVAFAFLAGIVTILSPCILPILPVILSSSVDSSGKRRPLGVVVGFVASFTFFTLFLSTIVRISGIPADYLRFLSIFILIVFGTSLLIPKVLVYIEQLFSHITQAVPQRQNRKGFLGGVIIGLSLGLLWTPCVGPILASVITLALSGAVTWQAFLVTLAYSLGTAIPMLGIMLLGSTALQKVPWLLRNSGKIQKVFGVLMIITAIGIFFNVDRRFQTYVLTTFPKYGVGLTQLEDNEAVKKQLDNINQGPIDMSKIGKPASDMVPKEELAPEIIPGGVWFNSQPLKLSELRGKVVLIDFWTYTCINCQRTFPYLRAWHEKYKDTGLVIIGVHSPEFEFEKSETNVAQAIRDFALPYPIVQDNDFATWRAYNNRYWPAKYLIDKEGVIRYNHFGEGAYDETEQMIQKLLSETGAKEVPSEIDNPNYQVESKTPETYLGFGRIDNFASNEPIKQNAKALYTAPKSLGGNQVAFAGRWDVSEEFANPQKGAKLYLNFESKIVFLVMRSKTESSKVKVFLDDSLNQTVTVHKDGLYKLVDLETAGRHDLKLEFEDDNLELFALTFG